MLGNDKLETANTEVTLIWCRNDIEKSMRRTHQYFVDFESYIHVEISTSNPCHDFHVDSPLKIDEISMHSSRRISTSKWWPIDEDVSIGNLPSRDRMSQWCHLKFLKPRANRGTSGTNAKIDDLMIILESLALVLHIYSCF